MQINYFKKKSSLFRKSLRFSAMLRRFTLVFFRTENITYQDYFVLTKFYHCLNIKHYVSKNINSFNDIKIALLIDVLFEIHFMTIYSSAKAMIVTIVTILYTEKRKENIRAKTTFWNLFSFNDLI